MLHFKLHSTDGSMFFIQETVDILEENMRELKTQLKIQIKKSEELEMLKKNMAKELFLYRQVQSLFKGQFLIALQSEFNITPCTNQVTQTLDISPMLM